MLHFRCSKVIETQSAIYRRGSLNGEEVCLLKNFMFLICISFVFLVPATLIQDLIAKKSAPINSSQRALLKGDTELV